MRPQGVSCFTGLDEEVIGEISVNFLAYVVFLDSLERTRAWLETEPPRGAAFAEDLAPAEQSRGQPERERQKGPERQEERERRRAGGPSATAVIGHSCAGTPPAG